MTRDVDSINRLTETIIGCSFRVLVELKAVQEPHDRFTAQCLNYLKATGLPVCLLLNFGKPQLDIKRYAHPNCSK